MNSPLPVYQHPALTVLVDDNQDFLESIAFRLGSKFTHLAFSDARAALDWLQHEYPRHAPENMDDPIRIGYDEQTDFLERRSTSIDLEPIYQIATSRWRFSIPAVLVVDYAMPQMGGLEFCKAVRHLPCKKIMLTGQADEQAAIEAFNCGLIDRFINKGIPDAMARLEAGIADLQREFFAERTATLNDLLSRHSFAFLSDPSVARLVEQMYSRYRFVEHYLFPNPEGILFFDARGNATLMVIATKASLKTQLEVAQDQGAPAELLAALQELRLVAFFSDTGGAYLQEIGEDWLPYCLPPQICQGRENYYWALFELPRHYLRGRIYSHAEFLQNRQGDKNAPSPAER